MSASALLGRLTRRRASTKASDIPVGMSPTTPERLAIRQPRISFDDTPLHWIPDDPQTAHTINVLHLLLPEGERWFCRAFHAVMPRVQDRGLRMQMRGFIGQEVEHANAHQELYELLMRNDIDPQDFLKYIDWLFHTALAEQPFGFPLSDRAQEEWDLFRLAGVAAIEHFTGLLGSWLLRSEELKEAAGDEAMMNLLLWHAAEEVEHQAVAHNIYRHLNGPEYLRWAAMGLTLPVLTGLWIWGTIYMQRRDPIQPSTPTPWALFRAMHQKRLPTLGYIFGSVFPTYFRKDYYPGIVDPGAVAIAEEYLQDAPGIEYAHGASATA